MPAYRHLDSAESLVRSLLTLASNTGRDDIPEREFVKATGVKSHRIQKIMGSYGALRQAAGLKPAPNTKLTDDTLLRRLHTACIKAGGIPPAMRLERYGACSRATYYARWGSWRGTLTALKDWVEKNDPEFPLMTLLRDPKRVPLRAAKDLGPCYGEPLYSGPLQHAPMNEMGVVALFGGMATQLGFVIERVGTGFPDCEAKQLIRGDWRRVRIEFEYQSRNFQRHNHDPAGCDLIVCWEHNWAEAPVEVLELRSEIGRRSGQPVTLARPGLPSSAGRVGTRDAVDRKEAHPEVLAQRPSKGDDMAVTPFEARPGGRAPQGEVLDKEQKEAAAANSRAN